MRRTRRSCDTGGIPAAVRTRRPLSTPPAPPGFPRGYDIRPQYTVQPGFLVVEAGGRLERHRGGLLPSLPRRGNDRRGGGIRHSEGHHGPGRFQPGLGPGLYPGRRYHRSGRCPGHGRHPRGHAGIRGIRSLFPVLPIHESGTLSRRDTEGGQ